MKEISIKEDFIKLDAALKLAGFVSTGGHAKMMIQDGAVTVNGEVCTQRGKKLRLGDQAKFDGQTLKIVHAGS
ncbi:MAG: RNA-binding S4 domain-containing protein [Clostridia bacterium]|nr:RNA-binding S4 domain-containing protein [Clostridia bacterium]